LSPGRYSRRSPAPASERLESLAPVSRRPGLWIEYFDRRAGLCAQALQMVSGLRVPFRYIAVALAAPDSEPRLGPGELMRHRPEPRHRLVGLAERDALLDQGVGQLDREQIGREALLHALGNGLERRDRGRQRPEQAAQRVGGVEHRFLVFLEILLIARRQPL